MKKSKYVLGLSLIGAILSLVAVAPALADDNNQGGASLGASVEVKGQLGVPGPGMMGQRGNQGNNGNDFKRGGMMQRPAVIGVVSAISGNTITVTSRGFGRGTTTATTTYSVDASAATVIKGNATSSISSIAVGDNIFVLGTISGTNVKATMIRDGMIRNPMANPGEGGPQIQGNGEPVVAGKVTAVSGNNISISNASNLTYTIDATNAKFNVRGQTAPTISNISVGDQVIAQGTVNGTAVTASLVIDQGAGNQNNNSQGENRGGQGNGFGLIGSIGNFFKHLFGF